MLLKISLMDQLVKFMQNSLDWQISMIGKSPKMDDGRPIRKAAYVIPPEDSDSTDSNDSEPEPLLRLAKRARLERDNSDSEDDIPLMELARRLKSSNQSDSQLDSQNINNEPQFEPSPEADVGMSSDNESEDLHVGNDNGNTMEVDCVTLRNSGSNENDFARSKLVPELNSVSQFPIRSNSGFDKPFGGVQYGDLVSDVKNCMSAPAGLQLGRTENTKVKRLLSAISDML